MESIAPIMDIIRTLRGENGCAWDRKQTPLSMWKCLAEEVYELQDAISKDDLENIQEEMGDVLFQVLFIMEIFHDKKEIPFSGVVDRVARKMIRRHPHVYESAVVGSEQDLLDQWERIKAMEKKENGSARGPVKSPANGDSEAPASVLDAIPSGMPSLLRAMKVSKSAVRQGFDWENIHQVLDTVKEEIAEFESALEKGDKDEAMLEFGDILFTLVNVARFAGFHPETALSRSTAKFEGRFRLMETALQQDQMDLKEMSPPEKDRFWRQAKQDYDT